MVSLYINKLRTINNQSFNTPDFLNLKYFPSLDGWRAVAIIIVLLDHLKINQFTTSLYYKIAHIFIYGKLGVRIFFVLSGFLITTLLIKEYQKTNTINIKRFYIKRFLRIFPVLYLYLFVLSILNYFFNLGIRFESFLSAAFYISNFAIFEGNWYTGHSWTLSVEEQYYLIWPFIFSYVINRVWILILFLFVGSIILKTLWYFYPNTTNFTLEPFLNYVTPIFMGALFSILSFKNFFNKDQSIWYNKLIFISCVVIVVAINIFSHYGILGIVLLPFGGLISNLIISFLIIRSLIHSNSYSFRFLNTRVMTKIGIISYSIYIWQQVFLAPSNVGHIRSLWEVFPLNIIITFIVAYLSYTYYESYFLNVKKRLHD